MLLQKVRDELKVIRRGDGVVVVPIWQFPPDLRARRTDIV